MCWWSMSCQITFPISTMTVKEVRNAKVRKVKHKIMTLEDYYNIEDSICQLTRLRAYQLADIFGKYKLF